MATRQTRLITKNSVTSGATLPNTSNILKGEAVVNLNDGILFYSGSTGASNFINSDNPTSGYFEVGSNLYQLKIRDKITSYSGVTTGLAGQFLSGTSTGFVLAPISSIAGVDTYVTGFTYDASSNTFTITQTESGPTKTATFDSVSGLTINGNLTVTGNTNLSGTTLYDETVSGTNPLEVVNVNYLTSFTQTNDVYVTGATYTSATNDTDYTSWSLQYHGTPIGGPYSFSGENTFVTGGTYAAGTITFKYNNSGKSDFTVTGIDGTDTYVTGGTNTAATTSSPNATINLLYNQDVAPGTYTLPYSDVFVTGFSYSNNTFTIKDNSGNTYSDVINTVTGLTINGDLTVTGTSTIGTIISSALSTGRVVYTTTGGQLTTEAGFEYDQNTDTLTVDNVNATGDVVIDGNLTVYGASISAFTSNLYVEDNNIFLNYNPTGTTTGSSLGAGWTIQDGSGISNTATTLNIGKSYGNSNFTNTEYTSAVGNENRNLFTQVGDILIRNTNYNENNPDGKRVLAEGDVLDGGTY